VAGNDEYSFRMYEELAHNVSAVDRGSISWDDPLISHAVWENPSYVEENHRREINGDFHCGVSQYVLCCRLLVLKGFQNKLEHSTEKRRKVTAAWC
ncbi:10587_t:CDS:2, partial [Entrophospora sp. SA101]